MNTGISTAVLESRVFDMIYIQMGFTKLCAREYLCHHLLPEKTWLILHLMAVILPLGLLFYVE